MNCNTTHYRANSSSVPGDPTEDAERLKAMGVARIYTPKDYDVGRIMAEIVDVVEASHARAA